MMEPIAKWFAVFKTYNPFRQEFVSMHPEFEAAKMRADFEIESVKKMAKYIVVGATEITYIVIEVPIVYCAQWKKGE